MNRAKIKGIGFSVPERVVKNSELEKHMDTFVLDKETVAIIGKISPRYFYDIPRPFWLPQPKIKH